MKKNQIFVASSILMGLKFLDKEASQCDSEVGLQIQLTEMLSMHYYQIIWSNGTRFDENEFSIIRDMDKVLAAKSISEEAIAHVASFAIGEDDMIAELRVLPTFLKERAVLASLHALSLKGSKFLLMTQDSKFYFP